MSGYGQAIGYANTSKGIGIKPARKIRKQKVKLTFRQRIRNWLMREDVEEDVPQIAQAEGLNSEGMRMQIYKASGGYVVETRHYDNQKDRHYNNIHIITDNDDLGDSLGKIVMMEALKR